MLPTQEAIAVSTGLAERFGLPYWQFTLTATDANRHAIRYARLLELQQYLHLHAINRGVLLTPFHNMALMCPDTTAADVEAHSAMFLQCVEELLA